MRVDNSYRYLFAPGVRPDTVNLPVDAESIVVRASGCNVSALETRRRHLISKLEIVVHAIQRVYIGLPRAH